MPASPAYGQADAPDQHVLTTCSERVTGRRSAVMSGNAITTRVFNFGSTPVPGEPSADLAWHGLGYGSEFGPFVAAEVIDDFRETGQLRDPQSVPKRDRDGEVITSAGGDTVWVTHVVSDGLSASSGGERSPTGEYWGWSPAPCTASGLPLVYPDVPHLPTSTDAPGDNGRPEPWPEAWHDARQERYVWPHSLPHDAVEPAQEAFFVMHDYANREFAYLPVPPDSSRRGLGIELSVRVYQWDDERLDDAIVFVYTATNRSAKDLENIIFGTWGDPHIGGANDYADDRSATETPLGLAYSWDEDGLSEVAGLEPGYLGLLPLQSPGHAHNGIDDDGDGLVDERQDDGLDNDGDWAATDDVGRDGLPDTGDPGEGDGRPTAGNPDIHGAPGEPHFEFNDPDEADAVAPVPFQFFPFGSLDISNDEAFWRLVHPTADDDPRYSGIPQDPGDYMIVYRSSPLALRAGERQRWTVALVLGTDREDLFANVRQLRSFHDAGYRYERETATAAVPNDERLSLTAYPNPLGTQTTLRLTLAHPATATVRVYDVTGRLVRELVTSQPFPRGTHVIPWDGRTAGGAAAPGVYAIRVSTPTTHQTELVTLVR